LHALQIENSKHNQTIRPVLAGDVSATKTFLALISFNYTMLSLLHEEKIILKERTCFHSAGFDHRMILNISDTSSFELPGKIIFAKVQ